MAIEIANGVARVDWKLRVPKVVESRQVEPSFIEGGVRYYDENPSVPETVHPRQIVLPLSEPDVLEWVLTENESFNANEPDPKKRHVVGFGVGKDNFNWQKPGVGGYEHCAVINLDDKGNFVSYGFDIALQKDGPINPETGVSKGGTVIAPIEKVGDQYYARCFWKYRPQYTPDDIVLPPGMKNPDEVRKYVAENSGIQMLTVPGGYKTDPFESDKDTAERRAKELAGLRIYPPVMRKTPWVQNRSNSENGIHIGFSMYESDGHTINPGRNEIVTGAPMAVNIRELETMDAFTQIAVDFAARELLLKR